MISNGNNDIRLINYYDCTEHIQGTTMHESGCNIALAVSRISLAMFCVLYDKLEFWTSMISSYTVDDSWIKERISVSRSDIIVHIM